MRPNTSDLSTLCPYSGGTDELLAVSSTAVAFATTFAGAATAVLVTVGEQPIRVTFDGSTPTASDGHYWAAGKEVILSLSLAQAAKFIRQGATDSDVKATPMGRG